MKLSRKILKFTEPLTYRRGWRRAQRSIFPVSLKPMLAQIDWDRAREIQQRYANSTAGYAKYADIEPWLRLNRERVQDLNLHRSEPKRVLDLGCGGGFFLFILRNLGHSGIGLDIDRDALRVAAENARLNAVDDRFTLAHGGPETVIGSWPLVLANVLAAPLIDMAAVCRALESASAKKRYVCRFLVAGAYADLGETGKALDSLERAYAEGST